MYPLGKSPLAPSVCRNLLDGPRFTLLRFREFNPGPQEHDRGALGFICERGLTNAHTGVQGHSPCGTLSIVIWSDP